MRGGTSKTTYDAAKAETRVTTTPEGLHTTRVSDPGGVITTTTPDGMVTTQQLTPDPRFGMTAPVQTITEKTPSGISRVSQAQRTVALSDPADLLSVVTRTDVQTLNGRSWTTVYDVATDVETLTSPAGRTTTQRFDALGHLLELDVPGVLPVLFGYDANGRLTDTTQGTRVSHNTFGDDGWLATATDPLHQTTSLTRDPVGRVLDEQRPDLAFTAFQYDADGNTTAVTPPGKPEHDFTFDDRELLASYDPPVLASGATNTGYSYNLDKQPLETDQPGPRLIDYGYDAFGRLTTTTFPTGVITRTYDSAGRVATVSGPTGVNLAYGYDGNLLNTITWSGSVSGTLAWTFDSDFRVANETIDGLFPVAFGYDQDSLLTSAGGLTITRDPMNGRVVSTLAGIVADSRGYDPFGALASMSTTANGSPLLSFAYVRDDLGRIVQKTETEGGLDTVFQYAYDDLGRLTDVTENGDPSEHYEYDLNGNRIVSQNAEGSFAATVDAQDKLLTYGALTFTYDLNGDLATKTDTLTGATTEYAYDALGNLREVVLPDGTVIEYLVDGLGTRVAKSVNGAFGRGWLWQGPLRPLAEFGAGGTITKRFVYAGAVNVPALMITPTATYRFVKDQLGSVRAVINVATGEVLQEIEYDTWGRVLVDTNPDFQPFGFAGGLYDADAGVVRFGARDYNPEIGRWVEKDPIGFSGGLNQYEYVASDPVSGVDPSGLDFWDDLSDWIFDHTAGRNDKPEQARTGLGDAARRMRGATPGGNNDGAGGAGPGGSGSPPAAGASGSSGGAGLCDQDPEDDDDGYEACKDLPIAERSKCCRDATNWRDQDPPKPQSVFRMSPEAAANHQKQTAAYNNYNDCMGW